MRYPTRKEQIRLCSAGGSEWKSLSCVQIFVTPWNSPGQYTGLGSSSLLQGIFPTQGSNPGLPHCMWILCQLSHTESPRILEWVAYPFSRRSSLPRNQTGISCTVGRFFNSWDMREASGNLEVNREKICEVAFPLWPKVWGAFWHK